MKSVSIAILSVLFSFRLYAQDPEFPKEFIIHLNVRSGMVTNFDHTPELYAGGIQLVPQYTLVTNLLRGGIIADGFYTDKKVQGAFGPTLSIKLTTLKAKPFGSLGNINASINHLWGTGKQRLLGGGVNADLFNMVVFGLSLQRDYGLHNWWLQSTMGIRISKKRKIKDI